MSDTYHRDILYLREQECGNPWLIWKPEEVRERKGFGKVDTNYMATGLCCNVRGSNPDRENRNFPSPKRPDRLWVPKSLTFNGYHGPLLGVKREGPKFNLSPSSSAKAKNEWSHSSTPPCVFTIQTGTTSPLPNPPNLAKYMVTQHSLCANHKNKQKANFKKTEVRNLTKDKVTVHHSDPVHAAKWSDEEHVKIISAL